MENKNYIQVGCGALIVNDKQETLLLKRSLKSKNGSGFWAQPGGRVEYGERIEDAVIREVKEEIGVDIELKEFLGFVEHIFTPEKEHWITFNYLAKIIGGEEKNVEPEKHDEIRWFKLNELPENLTYTIEAVNEYLRLRK